MEDRILIIVIVVVSIVAIAFLSLAMITTYRTLTSYIGHENTIRVIITDADDYMLSIQSKVVKGNEILNSLMRYRNKKDKVNLSYNYYKDGPYDIITSDSNWNNIIIEFMDSNIKDKEYLVTISESSRGNKLMLTFSCNQ